MRLRTYSTRAVLVSTVLAIGLCNASWPVAQAKDGGSSDGGRGSDGGGSHGGGSSNSGGGSNGSGGSGGGSRDSGSSGSGGSGNGSGGSSHGSEGSRSDSGGPDKSGSSGSGSSGSSGGSGGSGGHASAGTSGPGSENSRGGYDFGGRESRSGGGEARGKGFGDPGRVGRRDDRAPFSRGNNDQDLARQAVANGLALPLREITPTVQRVAPGRIIDVNLDQISAARWVYGFVVLATDGTYHEVFVDARRNRVLDVRRR